MKQRKRSAFSLIELIVVIAICLMLIAILLAVLAKARRGAHAANCLSNLRSVGQALAIYQNNNKGWAFPVMNDAFGVIGLGLNVPPHERWPIKVFVVAGAPLPPPYESSNYVTADAGTPDFDPQPYTPDVLVCPSDDEPAMAHTYVLNNHLADAGIRAGKRVNGVSSSEIIVTGEKREQALDYYMEWGDYERVVDRYKHGERVGAHYLYVDGHASPALPGEALRGIDPWDPTRQ